MIASAGGSEGQAALSAGFDDDAAGLAVAGDRLPPENDPGSDFATENQAERAVLNDDQARLEAQPGVVAGPRSPRETWSAARAMAFSGDAASPSETLRSR